MKLNTLLLEHLVNSSWIEDISYYGRHNKMFPGEEIITFRVKTGARKTYIVRGLTRRDYINWIKSPSKGRMFHVLKHEFARGWWATNPFRIIDYSKIKPSKKITWNNSKNLYNQSKAKKK